MAGPATQIRGLKEFRRDLKAMDPKWPRELAKVHRDLGRNVASDAQSRARGLGRQQAAAAPAIKGYGTQTKASIGVADTARIPFAEGAFWGSKAYPQFPAWVGNTWDAAVRGQGPYAINDAAAAYVPRLMHDYEQMVDHLADRAFDD